MFWVDHPLTTLRWVGWKAINLPINYPPARTNFCLLSGQGSSNLARSAIVCLSGKLSILYDIVIMQGIQLRRPILPSCKNQNYRFTYMYNHTLCAIMATFMKFMSRGVCVGGLPLSTYAIVHASRTPPPSFVFLLHVIRN